ncbi:hypothetical protein KQX54_015612 [Cotesia glomerata]|uniref:Uncharacterized protein n=1 Tax=Cotesia glomerata TaxID=32391 RepID=A0AAV7HXI3_COTGL|nr:hypothetical protein KQX54_015612 [Cotesia glomerata]
MKIKIIKATIEKNYQLLSLPSTRELRKGISELRVTHYTYEIACVLVVFARELVPRKPSEHPLKPDGLKPPPSRKGKTA